MLRPRLEALWADAALLHKETTAVEADLDALARGVKSALLVETMLHAYLVASAAARGRLDEVLPQWLERSGHAAALQQMIADQSLDPSLKPFALAWLEAAGVNTAALKKSPSLHFGAYYHDDADRWGEPSQAYIVVLWYTSPRRNRIQGLGLLLDYNPPWDGSVKDALITSRRAPDRLLDDVLGIWERGGMIPRPISPEQAKTVILTALKCNQAAQIRLHRDLQAMRNLFEQHVLSLPDAPDTPSFTMDDFDRLARQGQPSEEIMRFERTVGRRVRLEDGSEALYMGELDWDEE
jgi:hypothetical protein